MPGVIGHSQSVFRYASGRITMKEEEEGQEEEGQVN
jgi:hypothetical protein